MLTFSELMELHRSYWDLRNKDCSTLRFGQFVVNSKFPESGEAMSDIFYENDNMRAFDMLLPFCVEK